jgi:hypothetical protein
MTQVEITAVGALVRPLGDDRSRPKRRGDRVELSEDDAHVLVGNGTAKLVDQRVADDAEEEQPMGGRAIDLSKMTVPELRQFADDRRIRLTGARTRPEILAAIAAALDAPEAGDAIRAAAIDPDVAEQHPLVNPEAAEPGGPASPQPAPDDESAGDDDA